MKVSLYLNESYVNSKGECMMYLRAFINRKYLLIPLNFHVRPVDYNKEEQVVLRGKRKAIYNHLIKDAIGKASNIILKYRVNDKTLTREAFEKEFTNPALMTDFYAFMEHEIKSRHDELTNTSIRQHLTILNKMRAFRPALLFAEIDEKYLVDFQRHLRVKLKNGNNTVNNALKVMKVYINKALKQELITKSPFQYFKIKREKTYPEFLSEDEITKLISIYNSETLRKTQHKVLRWFLFCCQTGLRIGDLRNARHEDIRNGILSIHPVKTLNVNNRRVDIPLNNLAKRLIKDENKFRIKGNLFDCISEPKMRENIKNIVEFAEIDKEISWHTSRHTFATLFLKKSTRANGIIMLQKLLGHSSIESTMVYAHILNDDLVDAMKNFNF